MLHTREGSQIELLMFSPFLFLYSSKNRPSEICLAAKLEYFKYPPPPPYSSFIPFLKKSSKDADSIRIIESLKTKRNKPTRPPNTALTMQNTEQEEDESPLSQVTKPPATATAVGVMKHSLFPP